MQAKENLTDMQEIAGLVYDGAALLDREAFGDWLGLFDEAGAYELGAYSAELRKMTIWWRADTALLAKQLREAPQHVRDPAARRHVLGLPRIAVSADRATAECPFAVYRTSPAGESSLYLVGRYEDEIVRRAGKWRYVRRRVVSDTRVLDSFTHIPI